MESICRTEQHNVGFNPSPRRIKALNNDAHEVKQKKGFSRFIDDARFWQQTYDALPDIMFIVDREFRIIRANKAACESLGSDVIGRKCFKLIYGVDDPVALCPACQVFHSNQPVKDEKKIHNLGNRWYEVSAYPIKDDHDFVWHSLHIFRDIDTSKNMESQLQELQIKDVLTGLHNRRHFNDIFQREFDLASRRMSGLVLLVLNLDSFKQVNNLFGHEFGDFVLTEFAHLLRGRVRKTDICARVGGEEFAILLPDADLTEGEMIARNIHSLAEQFIYNDGDKCQQVTVSIGLASFNENEPQTTDELLSFANQALFEAKESGRNRVEIYMSE